MPEQTSEGLQHTGLDPNPVGKPNPEEIDPQLTSMVVDRIREGIGLVPAINTIAKIISWGRNEVSKSKAPSDGPPYSSTPPLSPPTPLPKKDPGPPSTQVSSFVQALVEQTSLDAPSAFDILGVCLELSAFLIKKNAAYGDSALDPVRIMSSADPAEQIRVRMDDKLSRLMRGSTGGEDALKDLVGYWVLMRVAEKRSATNGGKHV
jgi:hypothetical protein